MTLKFNRVLEDVKVHVHAKFHRPGSRVIVIIEKKTPTKTVQSVATTRTVTMQRHVHTDVRRVEKIVFLKDRLSQILHITIDTQSINSNSSCHFFFRYLLLIE